MQVFDKCKSEKRYRVGTERCHWTDVLDSVKSEYNSLLSNHQDNTTQLLMAKVGGPPQYLSFFQMAPGSILGIQIPSDRTQYDV